MDSGSLGSPTGEMDKIVRGTIYSLVLKSAVLSTVLRYVVVDKTAGSIVTWAIKAFSPPPNLGLNGHKEQKNLFLHTYCIQKYFLAFFPHPKLYIFLEDKGFNPHAYVSCFGGMAPLIFPSCFLLILKMNRSRKT